ncbi:MAG: hypothetical protein J0H34_14660 [Rhizobiales bacterium]|nr:hypothetical protein [Hyphomicrobiales bacterium]
MKKLILASVSAVALFGIAACSDSGADKTTTQSTTPPATEQTTPPADTNTMKPADDNAMKPADQAPAPAPAQ